MIRSSESLKHEKYALDIVFLSHGHKVDRWAMWSLKRWTPDTHACIRHVRIIFAPMLGAIECCCSILACEALSVKSHHVFWSFRVKEETGKLARTKIKWILVLGPFRAVQYVDFLYHRYSSSPLEL